MIMHDFKYLIRTSRFATYLLITNILFLFCCYYILLFYNTVILVNVIIKHTNEKLKFNRVTSPTYVHTPK